LRRSEPKKLASQILGHFLLGFEITVQNLLGRARVQIRHPLSDLLDPPLDLVKGHGLVFASLLHEKLFFSWCQWRLFEMIVDTS